MKIYLVRQGDDGPDSSPYPIKAFKSLGSAIKFCKIKQEELKNKHLQDWPGGSFRWEVQNHIIPYYCRSYMRFDPNKSGLPITNQEYPDDVLMVQEIEFEE